MSSQRSGCEKRKRKACKEAELLKIKSKCSIKNYFTSSTSNFQSCKYLINFLIVIIVRNKSFIKSLDRLGPQ